MPPLDDVLKASDYFDRDDFYNFKRRGYFSTKFKSGTPGSPLKLSRDNALEVLFLAALSRVGFSPSEAREQSSAWLRDEKSNRISKDNVWVPELRAKHRKLAQRGLHAAGRYHLRADASFETLSFIFADQIETGWLDSARQPRRNSTIVCCIDVYELVQRVNDLVASDDQ